MKILFASTLAFFGGIKRFVSREKKDVAAVEFYRGF